MSLELYLIKGSKPNIDQSKTYSYQELSDKGYNLFEDEKVKEDYMEDIKLVSIPCSVIIDCYDFDKICKKYNVSSADWCGSTTEEQFFSTNKGIISIKNNIIKDFCNPKTKIFWVCELERVAYWRNNSEIAEMIEGILDRRIENCGCYHVNYENLLKIDELTFGVYDLSQYEEDTIFYKEWY